MKLYIIETVSGLENYNCYAIKCFRQSLKDQLLQGYSSIFCLIFIEYSVFKDWTYSVRIHHKSIYPRLILTDHSYIQDKRSKTCWWSTWQARRANWSCSPTPKFAQYPFTIATHQQPPPAGLAWLFRIDPHCAWDATKNLCVAVSTKLHDSDADKTLFQDITTGKHKGCGYELGN